MYSQNSFAYLSFDSIISLVCTLLIARVVEKGTFGYITSIININFQNALKGYDKNYDGCEPLFLYTCKRRLSPNKNDVLCHSLLEVSK